MKTNQKKYKTSLSLILLFVFLFAVTISVFSYFLSVTARQKQTQEKLIIQKISNHFENLDTAMLSTFHSLSYLSQKESLVQFSCAQNPSLRRLYAIDVQKDIQFTMLSGSYLSYCQIAVMCMEGKEDAMIITQDSSYSLNQYAQETGMEEEQLSEIYWKLESRPFGHNISHSTTVSGREYVHYAIPVSYTDVPLVLILSIDRDNFEQAFPFSDYQDWMIFSGDEILMTRDGMSEDYQQFVKKFLEQKVTFEEGGVTQTSLSFNENPVVSAPFSQIGWTFAGTYREKKVTPSDVYLLFLLPLLCLFLCSLLPVRLISRYLYAPVDFVVTQLGGDTNETGNEFDFIWKKTSQISEKAQELNESLRQNQKLLMKQIIGSTFLGQTFSIEDLEDQSLWKQKYIALWIEKADALESSEIFALYKTALHEISGSLEDITFVHTRTDSFVFVIASSDKMEARDKVMELFAKVDLLSHIQVQVAISSCVIGIQNLHEAYEQCIRLLEYRYLLTERLFITAEDVKSIYYDGYYYPLKLENELIEKILSGTEGALILLEEILQENLMNKPLSPENKNAFFFALLSTLNRIYQELHIATDDGFAKISEMLKATNLDKVEKQMRSAYAKVLKLTQKRDENIKQDVSSRMMDFIYQNYGKDISLDTMAESLNLSPKYCSALFKRQTGNTFKRFLNEYRIEQAKKMLEEDPDRKISFLAEQVGFISANTFIQVFKQYTDTTPRQYAEMHKG